METSKETPRNKEKMAGLSEISKLNECESASEKKRKLDVAASEINSIDTEDEPKPKCLKTVSLENLETPLTGEIEPSGKAKLSNEDNLILGKIEHLMKMRHPNFFLRQMGYNASLKTESENRIPLFLSDVQHLILYSQMGVHVPYSPARWCCLDKLEKLLNTNILVVENLSMNHFTTYESSFQFLSSQFQHKLEVLYTKDFIKEISTVPITVTQVRKFINEYGSLQSAVVKSEDLFDTMKDSFPIEDVPSTSKNCNKNLPPSDEFPRTQLLLSGWELVGENFPLPIKGLMDIKFAGYVMTKDEYQEVTPRSPMFGIDCEMCKTSTGDLEVTKVSIVDEKLNVFYETLVKPHNQIIDYLTRYSGITPKMMKNVTTRLKDVQDALRKKLPADAILVGHSLNNDMHALKMMHPYIIDTSVIFNITGDRIRKTSLKILAKEFLSEKIQDSRKGHCSTEDSSASLKLAQLKLSKSIAFGDILAGNNKIKFRSYPELGNRNYSTSMLKQAIGKKKSASLAASEDVCAKYKYYVNKGSDSEQNSKIKFISKSSNKSVVKKFCESLLEHPLNIAHIRIPETKLGTNSIATMKTVDHWIQDVYNNTATSSLCIVIFGGQKDGGNGCCFIQVRSNC